MAPNKISMCGCTGHMLSQVNWTETIHGHGKQKEAASCVLELEDLGVTTWRELLTLADQWWNEQQPNHKSLADDNIYRWKISLGI